MAALILLLVVIPLALVFLIYRKLSAKLKFFSSFPIPVVPAKFFFGSTAPMLQKQIAPIDFVKDVYSRFPEDKVIGLLDTTTPVFLIRDLNLIKRLTVKDFDYFTDRRPMFGRLQKEGGDRNPDVLCTKTLASLAGSPWRDMRATLSPAFTGSKVRAMFELIVEYCEQLGPVYLEAGVKEYEWKAEFGRIATDIIATSAFGLNVNSIKDESNEFYTMGRQMLNFDRGLIVAKVLGYRLVPQLMTFLGVDIIDNDPKRYFSTIIREAIKTRNDHGIVRPDMIHLLMLARKGGLTHNSQTSEPNEGFATVEESELGKANTSGSMSDSEMIAQCLIFFLAGLDTISTTLSFLVYELALNEDIQDRLFQEIMTTKTNLKEDKLTYDSLQDLKYLDMVISETLRKWPPVPFADRYCVRDYRLQDGDLKFTIPQESCLWIPIHGLHHDPAYFPNPDRFDPERFSEENRVTITPGSYLPFGSGPRNCIGSRFALVEMKAIVFYLVAEFSFERTQNTQVPVRFSKEMMGVGAERGIRLKLVPRSTELLN
ncbi:cytochrome P450 9e2-like [Uranotaenia lowii]|uniref:cytochrome P450 9e2-like n=1 Tax=Uranotaenia lowii TaxID=190385 RepID=UPI00247A3DF1|nr:cytochrome P450 9e2-like [Uranotaenia lowii]